MTVLEVRDVIESHRYAFANEAELQAGLAEVFTRAEVPFEREVNLDKVREGFRLLLGRVDFLVADSIALEVKVDGSSLQASRQLYRYAESPRVRGLVLVTSRGRHRTVISALRTVGGKPFVVANAFKGFA